VINDERPVDDTQETVDEPAVAEAVKVEAPAGEIDDIKPIKPNDVADAAIEIARSTRDGFLKPAYKLGWRYMRLGKIAAQSFVEGALNDKGGKR